MWQSRNGIAENNVEGYADEVEVTINGRACRAVRGTFLGDILKKEGLSMPCAGMGRCGKCKVRVEGTVEKPDVLELEKLSGQELSDHIRLACRTVICGPCKVEYEEEGGMEIQLGEREILVKGEPLFDKFGVAIDVGTTTLAAQLYGKDGMLAQAGVENPQKVFGADVISRIGRSMAGEGEELKKAVCNGISELLRGLADCSGVLLEQIDVIIVTGNTAMLYLLMGRSPESLSHAPFQADWLAGEWIDAFGLEFSCPNAKVYFPPCISAFVGADITCAMLHTNIGNTLQTELLVDIGTNGEIVLSKGKELLCCATAAGPAFEGVGLSCGMMGKDGAIFRVEWEENTFKSKVLGCGQAKGICGSGAVDAVSCLLRSGQMDETGFLEEEAVFAEGVALLQEDIRKIQLAKGAIYAGILTMLQHADLQLQELSKVLVAGGFGSNLDIENAISIGLLPEVESRKVVACGNAALAGAADMLLNNECQEKIQELAQRAHTVELATDEYFKKNYVEGMLFGKG